MVTTPLIPADSGRVSHQAANIPIMPYNTVNVMDPYSRAPRRSDGKGIPPLDW
jgi:hypothetical protein